MKRRARKALKKYFIPHEENDHRPHILRAATVVFVILIAVVVESVFWIGTSYVAPRSTMFGIIVTNALVDETNQARTAGNVAPLHESALLDAAAKAKANDMAVNGYFAHTSPAGLTPWYWFEKVGYNFTSAGENLAVDFSDSQDVTNAWMNSPDHRANILNAGFTEIGMATARGTFEGHTSVFVVELFGTPSVEPIAFVDQNAGAPKSATAGSTPSVVSVVAPGTAASPASQPVFVAVAGAATGTAQTAPVLAAANAGTAASTNAAGNSAVPVVRATNPIQKLAADPRRLADYIYLAIIALFSVALILNIFVKIHIQHRELIIGGMLVILVAGLFIVLNQHMALSATTIL